MLSTSESTPALKPPTGLQSNLVDPPSHAYISIIVVSLVLALSTPVLSIRLYTRSFIHRKLWWDDWTCLMGWIWLVALSGLMYKALDYGGGVDIWNVSKANKINFTHLFHDIEIVARIGMFFIKVSIVLLYRRLFVAPNAHRSAISWSIWFVFWWNLLYALALVLTVATQCVGKPATKVEKGECLNQYAVLVCASVINVISDLMILIIPIAAIWGLQMARNQKIRVSVVFAIGSLGVIASVARLGYQIRNAKRPNQTVIFMNLLMLNIVEQMVGIIVACMPVFPSLFRHYSEKRSRSGPVTPTSKEFMNSFIARRQQQKTASTLSGKNPYSVHGQYKELGDLEGQRQEGPGGRSAAVEMVPVGSLE